MYTSKRCGHRYISIMINIYLILNIVTGKVYIGKTKFTIEKRFERHKKLARNRVNRYLYDAMNKYGFDNFKVFLIEITESKLQNDREKFWISKFRSNNPKYGYNMTDGGDGGATNVGKSMKGKTYKDAWKRKGEDYFNIRNKKRSEKISRANTGRFVGRTISKEQRDKLRKSAYNFVKRCKDSGNIPSNWFTKNYDVTGLKHSEESRCKFSEQLSGKRYEQRFGKYTAERLKELHKNRMIGNKNINYVEFDVDAHINELLQSKNLRKLCKEKYGITYATVLNKFKEKYNMTITEYRLWKKLM